MITKQAIENIILHYTGREGDQAADGLTITDLRYLCKAALQSLPAENGKTPGLDAILAEYPTSPDPTCNTAKEVLLEELARSLELRLTAKISELAILRSENDTYAVMLHRKESYISRCQKECGDAVVAVQKTIERAEQAEARVKELEAALDGGSAGAEIAA